MTPRIEPARQTATEGSDVSWRDSRPRRGRADWEARCAANASRLCCEGAQCPASAGRCAWISIARSN
jgi:hypothetical protein